MTVSRRMRRKACLMQVKIEYEIYRSGFRLDIIGDKYMHGGVIADLCI